MEIKSIVVPDGWECVVENGIVSFREKKGQNSNPPRSWEEFCKNYPRTMYEHFICDDSIIDQVNTNSPRETKRDKNICISKEEAEAFLALMQLRQLRKAWVGDWERPKGKPIAGIFYNFSEDKITTSCDTFWINVMLSFPTKEMAEDFLSCFNDLCEKAKILL